jgi:hypothetical protein
MARLDLIRSLVRRAGFESLQLPWFAHAALWWGWVVMGLGLAVYHLGRPELGADVIRAVNVVLWVFGAIYRVVWHD